MKIQSKILILAAFSATTSGCKAPTQAEESARLAPIVECVDKVIEAYDMYDNVSPRSPVSYIQARHIKRYQEACAHDWGKHEKNHKAIQKLIMKDFHETTTAEFSNMVYYYPFKSELETVIGQVVFSIGPEIYTFEYHKYDGDRKWTVSKAEWQK